MKKILLHACCAVCTAGVYYQLKNDFDLTLFWYNPNIFPKAEHDRRLTELLNFCDKLNIKILVGDYNWEEEHKFWRKIIKGFEKEPERGKRCEICYKMRLEATAAVAQQINNRHPKSFKYFGAELSVSPHKNVEMINKIGERVGKKMTVGHSRAVGNLLTADHRIKSDDRKTNVLRFYSADFKKHGGFQKSSEISKKYNLYRQSYCGCEFSKK